MTNGAFAGHILNAWPMALAAVNGLAGWWFLVFVLGALAELFTWFQDAMTEEQAKVWFALLVYAITTVAWGIALVQLLF